MQRPIASWVCLTSKQAKDPAAPCRQVAWRASTAAPPPDPLTRPQTCRLVVRSPLMSVSVKQLCHPTLIYQARLAHGDDATAGIAAELSVLLPRPLGPRRAKPVDLDDWLPLRRALLRAGAAQQGLSTISTKGHLAVFPIDPCPLYVAWHPECRQRNNSKSSHQ